MTTRSLSTRRTVGTSLFYLISQALGLMRSTCRTQATMNPAAVDYRTLDQLRKTNPAWRLLVADNAPMIVSFLHKTFIQPNVRTMAQPELASRLADYLYGLREKLGEEAFPRRAEQNLDDSPAGSRGWLRKYYPPGSDEAHYDLTPPTERAIDWLAGFHQRQFVGAESRLMTVFALLREIAQGTEVDPASRIADLEKRKKAIEAEIAGIRDGHVPLLDPTQIKDRFQQPAQRLPRSGAEFPHAGPRRARAHRHLRGRQRHSAGGNLCAARRHRGERSGQELPRVLGFPDVARAAGGALRAAPGGLRAERGKRARAGPPSAAHSLRLAGGRRSGATHRGAALRAVAALPGRPSVAGESPHHATHP